MKPTARIAIVFGFGLLGLGLVYVFQRSNFALTMFQFFGIEQPSENILFIVNKTGRLLFNDLICFFMIFSIFKEKNFRKVAMAVFLIELFFILPAYLLIKLNLEGSSELSSPLLSFIHRLIVNPTLMVLTGIAFAYQKFAYPVLRKP
jgi:exosortase F-associated protein